MIELTPEQRRKIYEEERKRLEGEVGTAPLLITSILTALFVALLISLAKKNWTPTIETMRRAHEGTPPEEYKENEL